MIEFYPEDAIYLCSYSEIGERKNLSVRGVSSLDENTDLLVEKIKEFILKNDDNDKNFRTGLFRGMSLGQNTYHYISKLYVKKINFEDIKGINKGIVLLTGKDTYFYINNNTLEVFNKIIDNFNLKSIHIINPKTSVLDKLKIALNIQKIAI